MRDRSTPGGSLPTATHRWDALNAAATIVLVVAGALGPPVMRRPAQVVDTAHRPASAGKIGGVPNEEAAMAHEQHPVPRVKPSADPQVQAMITDPAGYFARARSAARREARNYVQSREQHPRPA